MKADVFEYEGEGIQCVYDNKKWVVCIKNWKPNNDIEKIHQCFGRMFSLPRFGAWTDAALQQSCHLIHI